MLASVVAIMVLFTSSLGVAEGSPAHPELISYGCIDVVVIGTLDNLDYQTVDLPDDILGHGWMTANLDVHRQVKGSKANATLPIKYFGHTYLREDKKFMFVLRPASDGTFRIMAAHLIETRPKLAEPCLPSEAITL
jgi:hypothetical protein